MTIPFEQTFRDLDLNRPTGGTALDDFNFCGCGWPQHMLLPRGTAEGYPMHLFVMISNYDDDRVSSKRSRSNFDASAHSDTDHSAPSC